MVNQICVISIYVPNLNQAIDFYTNTLGFELNKQYGPKIASLAHGELPIVLEENDSTIQNQDNKTTRVVLGLRTHDIYQTVKFLKEMNVNFIVEEPTDCPPGKYISFCDPFGNILEYLQFDNL
ncbi:VOC family protein [Sporosarcina aquimarina]|uniref:VOC family protein n=1 Tax=Sporosarcina aquimarina TaxID=114975 RepID=UPI00203BD34D|nr:VOC family protein [Sporosarcina aquimarina]MCM3758231.1 VOC family protein [Sporosarcina aquimarina]